MKRALVVLLFLIVGFGCEKKSTVQENWITLFDGKSLEGWTIRGGDADFSVVDGMIVGNSVLGAPNVFLCTEKEYSNFILEYDVKIDEGINSGMQIRSAVWEKDTTTAYLGGDGKESTRSWEAGRVWGYQIELDPSQRSWSGGFYEEGGRGWLVTLADNEAARNAFKKEAWNTFKVKADGDHFQIWVNGVLAVDTIDKVSNSGFFGLQLHGIKKDEQVGKKVWWRDIKIIEI